jgi:hypothetical protein
MSTVTVELSNADKLVLEKLEDVRLLLRQEKPGDRSEIDRRFAICLTELEKYRAIYFGLIINKEFTNE